MTKKEIRTAVQEIKGTARDPERAHVREDELYESFITYVAKRDDQLGEKARLVLSVSEIEFERWCA